MWGAASLELEKPQHTDVWNLATQGNKERIEIAFHVLAIVWKLVRIGQGEHRGEQNVSVGRHERQTLPGGA